MRELRFSVPGKPSTNHRPRFIGLRRGKPRFKPADDFAAFKERVQMCATNARPRDWPMHAIGPRGGKLVMLYAVSVVGCASGMDYDADNLRGVLDACEGILWPNDVRCAPASYDRETGHRDLGVDVTVIAWDPREGRMRTRFQWEGET